MGIQYRLALAIFTFTLLFLIAISFLFYNQSRSTMVESTAQSMEQSSKDIADYIDVYLEEEAHLASALANSENIETALLNSNAEYGALTVEHRQAVINELESRWKASRHPDSEMEKLYLHNPLSRSLRKQQQHDPEEYGEIFLTNQYGIVVGTTNRLTTITHAHKYWWQEAFNHGAGRIYFDDRGYDESVNGYVLGVVYPVMKNNQVIGILKINLNLLGTLNRFLGNIGDHGTRRTLLVRSGGRVVLEPGQKPLSTEIAPEVKQKFTGNFSGNLVFSSQAQEEVAAYAPIGLTFGSKRYGFGGISHAADHSQGNQEEGWYVVTIDSMKNILAPAYQTTRWILETGLIFAILTAVLAIFLGRAISHPVIKLTTQAQRIGQGELDAEINIDSSDEIGALAKAFNSMARNLKKITVSRDQMEEEVRQRRVAESKLRKLTLTDELTGLFNRRGFMEQGEKQLKLGRRTGNQLFLLYVDVDNLKAVNDTLGHEAGDELLRKITEILQATLRESDIIARLGDDEFAALIIEHSGVENIHPLQTRLIENIKAFNDNKEYPFETSISTGVARCEQTTSCTMEELIAKADQQMYQNKKHPKGDILTFPQPPGPTKGD